MRATRLPVAYLDDADVHEQMVRFARQSLAHGLNPLTRWFPFLNEGSPQFLHYQSLGAIVTGVFGLAVGGDVAFRWSLYLIWALWPIVIYASARIWGLRRWAAVGAAAVSPVLMSASGVGYEVNGYLWRGYGLWAQEWGMLFLPLAWACTWRALSDRRWTLPAVAAIAATICSHFETGYLALAAPALLVWFAPRAGGGLPRRIGRAVLLLVLSVAASAWAIIPLIVYRKWAAINEVLAHGPLVNGYGARVVMGWLVNGQIFDNGRAAIVTVLVALGALAVLWRWRGFPAGRALLVLGVFSLLLSWGRTTWGALMNYMPGGHDVFFRRFMFGVQLTGIYLAGLALAGVAELLAYPIGRVLRGPAPSPSPAPAAPLEPDPSAEPVGDAPAEPVPDPPAESVVDPPPEPALGRPARPAPAAGERRQVLVGRTAAVLVFAAAAALAVPVVRDVGAYTSSNAAEIAGQRAAGAAPEAQLAPILAYIQSHGGGRTYGGSAENWGNNFLVGRVPVYKYLETQDIDEVGFTIRTASLMSQPEFYFDQADNGDFLVFGIRWLIYPPGQPLPLGAKYVMHRGHFWLYELAQYGYVNVVDTIGNLHANRRDVGLVTESLLSGNLLYAHRDYGVAWPGRPAAAPTVPLAAGLPAGSPGTVVSEGRSLLDSTMPATVRLRRRAVVMLSSSFDPGWIVTVDGRRARTQILAPAVVGVTVGPGTHRVVFRYVGFGWYPELWALTAVALVAAGLFGWGRRPGRRPGRRAKHLARR